MMLLLLQVALALDWTTTPWKRAAEPDGVLRLPAGEPLRLGRLVEVREVDGTPVDLRAGREGWWIDPAPSTRLLVTDEPVAVGTVDRRAWRASWAAWEHDAALALSHERDVPLPPDGTGALAARVRARGRAVSRETALLGLLADTAAYRGLSHDALDALGPERAHVVLPGQTLEIPGDGLFRVGVRSLAGTFTRIEVGLGEEPWSIAASGRYAVFRDVLRAPGAPPLRIRGDAEVAVEVRVQRERVRGWATLPAGRSRPDGFAGVEWDALHGLPADFRPWLDDPDPDVAAWARVRVVETAVGAELEALADPAVPGDEAVAHAVLARAPDLPLDIPLAWLDQVEHPDPRALAHWLDGQRGSRPHGLALLDRALAGRPADRELVRDRIRHAAERTRWVALGSDRDDEGSWRFAPDGSGLPRLEVGPGDSARLTFQTADPELRRVVRFTAAPGTRLTLDGEPVEGEGELGFALASGEHTLAVQEGRVLLPTRDWEGGRPGVGWKAVPLPATFDLPGEGAPLELRVEADAPVELVFDDGRVASLPGSGTIRAGAHAGRLEVRGSGRVGVSARLLRLPSEEVDGLEVQDALDRIRATSAAIDGGDERARAERAVALARLGHRRLAWTDVRELASVDPDLHRLTWATVASLPVYTRLEGPLDVPSALAAGQSRRARALELLADGQTVKAFLEADTPDLQARVLRTFRWRPINRADQSGGLVPVRRQEHDPEGLFAEVDRALVRAPWPRTEVVEVREGAVDRITSTRPPLVLDLWCRDRSLQRAPCALAAVGAGVPGVVVGDGELERLVVRGREVEVGPVGEDQTVVLRATDRDGLLEPSVRRLALAVDGRLSVRLPADRLARVELVEGSVRPRSPVLATDDRGRQILHPGGRLVLDGRGVVLLAVSESRLEEDELLERPPRPELRSLLTVDQLWPELERAEHHTLSTRPTVVVTPSVVLARAGGVGHAWSGAELEASVLSSGKGRWGLLEAWARAPGGFGLLGEGGLRRARLLVGLRGWATRTARLDAGELGARLHLRAETGPKRAWLRADLWPRFTVVSADPGRVVDPRSWSLYRSQHPFGVNGRLSLLSEPTRDLRLRAYGQAVSNAGPSLDRVSLGLRSDLLLLRHQRFSLEGTLDAVLADAHRNRGRLTPSARLGYDVDLWDGPRRWLFFADAAANTRGAVVATAGVSVYLTNGRGLRDPPPTRDLFRTLREVP